MSKFKIYEAGRMSGLDFQTMNTWRIQAKIIFEGYGDFIHIINPVDYYNFLIDPNTYTDKEVKEFDLHAIKNSDLVLVNLNFFDSIGTAIECHMAHDVWGIPVIGFGTRNDTHPWIKLSETKHCETMEEAIEHIMTFYVPNK